MNRTVIFYLPTTAVDVAVTGMNHAIYLIKQARKRAMTPEEKEQERELSRLARQRAKRLERYLANSAVSAELAGLGVKNKLLGLLGLGGAYTTYLIPSVVGGAAGALAGGAADVEADYTKYKKPILDELRKKKKLRKPNLSPRKKD